MKTTLAEIVESHGFPALRNFIAGRHVSKARFTDDMAELEHALEWNKVDEETVVDDWNDVADNSNLDQYIRD